MDDPPECLSFVDDGVQPPEVTRTMVWLLLSRTPPGTGPDAALRKTLAEQWNKEFTPVVPRGVGTGTGAVQEPLTRAVRAAAGHGRAWRRDGPDTWRQASAADVLRRSDLVPVRPDSREATAVAGDLPALAEALHHHVSLRTLVRASTAGTQRLSALLGRGAEQGEQSLEDPYILRRPWQLIVASVDHITAEGARLTHSAVHHGQPPTAHAARQLLCLHRSAFLAERQQALVLDPRHNGGRLPFPASWPGAAGRFVEIPGAAAAHLRAIRAHRHAAERAPGDTPAGTTEVADALERAWWNVAWLFLALTELSRQTRSEPEAGLWRSLADFSAPFDGGGPLGDEVAATARWLERKLRTDQRAGHTHGPRPGRQPPG
ncbi:hypothetical protein [Streptomyces sp. NBC_01142]|uniref:hypothetical protein n=1 Tax=Streptomyces sp. NBC_01142 TaxID=2975865 RepID=UPI002259873F|nr:hypothetical protein [Streptomyces sp. NBC_01142]